MTTEQRKIISTDQAPAEIGTYSQAVQVTNATLTFISGQIPLDSTSGELVSTDFADQTHQVFKNLQAVAAASGASLADAVKLTVYLTDLANFATVNEIMARYIEVPYPARAAIQVSALPKGAQVEIDAILASND